MGNVRDRNIGVGAVHDGDDGAYGLSLRLCLQIQMPTVEAADFRTTPPHRLTLFVREEVLKGRVLDADGNIRQPIVVVRLRGQPTFRHLKDRCSKVGLGDHQSPHAKTNG